MQGYSLPAVFPNRAGTEHSEVLTLLHGRRIWCCIERVLHGNTRHRILRYAFIYFRCFYTDDVQNGWNDICGVMILIPHFATGLNTFGPGDDQRITGTTSVF